MDLTGGDGTSTTTGRYMAQFFADATLEDPAYWGETGSGSGQGSAVRYPMVTVEGGEDFGSGPAVQVDRDNIRYLRQAISSLNTKLDGYSGSRVITTKDGQAIPFAEVFGHWTHLNFNLTYSKEYPPGYGGGLSAVTDGWQSDIKMSAVTGYRYQTHGLITVALHELAHTFTAADDYAKAQWASWYNADPGTRPLWEDSDQFKNQERYANDIARQIGDIIGVDTNPAPKFGF